MGDNALLFRQQWLAYLALAMLLIGMIVESSSAAPTQEQIREADQRLIGQFDRIERELQAVRDRRVRNYLGKEYREEVGAAIRPPGTEEALTRDVDGALQQVRDGKLNYVRAIQAANSDRTRQLALSGGMEAVRHSLASYQYTLYGVHVRDAKWLADVNNARQARVKELLRDQYTSAVLGVKDDAQRLRIWQSFNARERVIDDPHIELYHQAVQRLEVTRRQIAGDYYTWMRVAERLGDAHQAGIFRQDVREKLASRSLNRGGILSLEAIDRPKSANITERYYRPRAELRATVLEVLGTAPEFVAPPEDPDQSEPDLVLFEVRTAGKVQDENLVFSAVIYNVGNAEAKAGFSVRFFLSGYDVDAGKTIFRELGVVVAEQAVVPEWREAFLAEYQVNADDIASVAQARSLRVVVDSDSPETLNNNRLTETEEWWNNVLDTPGPGN